jgi:tRNA (Thr-GGU) A37 N-methylase
MKDKLHGVFSIRAPRRSNPIGFSVVRLDKREASVFYLAEVDMMDGTPLLDIKPHVPKFDHRKNARGGWMEATFRDMKGPPVSDNRF